MGVYHLYTYVHFGSSGMEPTVINTAEHGTDAAAKRYSDDPQRDFSGSLRPAS